VENTQFIKAAYYCVPNIIGTFRIESCLSVCLSVCLFHTGENTTSTKSSQLAEVLYRHPYHWW